MSRYPLSLLAATPSTSATPAARPESTPPAAAHSGDTLAQMAVKRGSVEVLRVLTQQEEVEINGVKVATQVQDIDWNTKNDRGDSPLMIALKINRQ